MRIKGVIFDMDGTITECDVDFEAIRREARIPNVPILEYIEGLEEQKRGEVFAVLERHEARAAVNSRLRKGVMEVLENLRKKGIKTALLTRNSRRSVETILKRHNLKFDVVVSRDDAPPKPSPQPVLLIGKKLGLKPEELLVVGDFHFDVQAGKAAGARTAFLLNDNYHPPQEADYQLHNLAELLQILGA
ncbi:MAG TPA: HAD family hydrolase [Candidatus Hypogeohydataceae bacterium YC40]